MHKEEKTTNGDIQQESREYVHGNKIRLYQASYFAHVPLDDK
jgi:hypothetical protein